MGTADLAAVRFGISPGHELAHAVRALLRPHAFPLQWGWLTVAQRLRRVEEFDLLADVIGAQGYLPDFLTPAPTGDMTLDRELVLLLDVPLDHIARDLGKMVDRSSGARRERLLRLQANPADARQQINEWCSVVWDHLVAPFWPQIQRLARADINVRARRSADEGLAAMIATLHSTVSWSEHSVVVATQFFSDTVDCAGTGLMLVPSVMMEHDGCAVITERPATPIVIYPAHGVTEGWHLAARSHETAMAKLLGAGRSRLLSAVRQPLTTSEAAAQCDLAPATASHHLAVLRDAGLIDSRREGQRVLHTLTPIGQALAR